MPHSFSHAVSMNLEHSIKEGSYERYPDHLQCFRNIKKIKYPDFQAMTVMLFLLLFRYWPYQTASSSVASLTSTSFGQNLLNVLA